MSPPQSSGINPPIVEPIEIPIQIADRMCVDTTAPEYVHARKPPVRAWPPIVWQSGDSLPGPVLARRARDWVSYPEVLKRPHSRRPIAWSP
jgi:hypothetical protein